MKFETLAIHAGQEPDPNNGAVMTPDEKIYFDEQLMGLREKMDEIQFDSIWSKAHTMSMEQAIEFALKATHE